MRRPGLNAADIAALAAQVREAAPFPWSVGLGASDPDYDGKDWYDRIEKHHGVVIDAAQHSLFLCTHTPVLQFFVQLSHCWEELLDAAEEALRRREEEAPWTPD